MRGGTALHYAVRKRYKEVIKELASFGIDMNAVDQDGLTALDYTQSRGFMPFMALQTPLFKDEAPLLRELGATKLMAQSPVWPVLGPPQGVWEDIWPLGEPAVHAPIYKRAPITSAPSGSYALSGVTSQLARFRAGGLTSVWLSRRGPLPLAPLSRRRSAPARALGGALFADRRTGAHASRPRISAARLCSRAPAATWSRCRVPTAR